MDMYMLPESSFVSFISFAKPRPYHHPVYFISHKARLKVGLCTCIKINSCCLHDCSLFVCNLEGGTCSGSLFPPLVIAVALTLLVICYFYTSLSPHYQLFFHSLRYFFSTHVRCFRNIHICVFPNVVAFVFIILTVHWDKLDAGGISGCFHDYHHIFDMLKCRESPILFHNTAVLVHVEFRFIHKFPT